MPCTSVMMCYQQVATASAVEWKAPGQDFRSRWRRVACQYVQKGIDCYLLKKKCASPLYFASPKARFLSFTNIDLGHRSVLY